MAILLLLSTMNSGEVELILRGGGGGGGGLYVVWPLPVLSFEHGELLLLGNSLQLLS